MSRKILGIITVLAALLPFTACSQTPTEKESNMEVEKTLVVFFSRAGENYSVGNIEKGNTHIIAEMVAEETGGVLFQIEPVKAYPENYKECTEVAKEEADSNARPAIKGDVAIEDYDVIYIGYPNWWGDMPMPVYTFIEKHDWHGKSVVPFCTHEGSGLSDTENKLKTTCIGATVRKGLAIRGEIVQNSREQARKAVTNWLKN